MSQQQTISLPLLPLPTVESRVNNSHTIKKPAGHIPRPPNCFILYRSWARKQKLNVSGTSKNEQKVSKILGTLWAELPESTKDIFRQQAEAAKKAHREKYPDYRYTPAANSANASRPNRQKRKAQKMASSDEEECFEEAAKLKEAMIDGRGIEEMQLEAEMQWAQGPVADPTLAPQMVHRRSSSCPAPNIPALPTLESAARKGSQDDSNLPSYHASFTPYEPSTSSLKPRKKAKTLPAPKSRAGKRGGGGLMAIPTLPSISQLAPANGSATPPPRISTPSRTPKPSTPISIPFSPLVQIERPTPRSRMGVSTTGRIGPDPNFVFPPARTPLAPVQQASSNLPSVSSQPFVSGDKAAPSSRPAALFQFGRRSITDIQNLGTTSIPTTESRHAVAPRPVSTDLGRFLATDWTNVRMSENMPINATLEKPAPIILPALSEFGYNPHAALPEDDISCSHFVTPMGTFERRDSGSRRGSLSWLRRGSIGAGLVPRRNSVYGMAMPDRRTSAGGLDIQDYSLATRPVMNMTC